MVLAGSLYQAPGLTQRLPRSTGAQKCPGRCRKAALVSAIATRPKAPAPLPDDVQALERSLQLESTSTSGREHAASQPQQRTAASKRTLDQEEVFHSTAEHRAWVFGTTALFSATLARGLSDIHDVPTALGAAAAALLAYYVSGARACAVAPQLPLLLFGPASLCLQASCATMQCYSPPS